MTKKFITRNTMHDALGVSKIDTLPLLVHIGWLVPTRAADGSIEYELTASGRKAVSPASTSAGGRATEYDLEALKAAFEKHIKPATNAPDARKVDPDSLPDRFITRAQILDLFKMGSNTLTDKLEKAGITAWDPLYRTQGGMVPTANASTYAQLNSKGHYEWNAKRLWAAMVAEGVV